MTAAPRFDPTQPAPRLSIADPRRLFEVKAPDPLLLHRHPAAGETAPVRRRKIWELSSNLHCSIIGTCLSTGELRQLLAKLNYTAQGASDHDLHGQGVMLAGRHDGAAKLLNKALDQRHRLAINRFDKAKTLEELRPLWRDAVQRGDIPGAYWAVLTHPAANAALVREVFGEVHMLSHLVGAANRADIRRLAELQAELGALRAKAQRQQDQLREAVTSRDTTIRDLNALLARRIAAEAERTTGDTVPDASERATLEKLVAALERRLDQETRRRTALEQRLEDARAALQETRDLQAAAERSNAALGDELRAIEARFHPAPEAAPDTEPAAPRLDGLALLYVGGRPNQIGHLRALGERLGALFLAHDGGLEERGGLLAGLVNRADVVLFPVDCVSHEAVSMVKRLCRQAAKPYMPLRSAGLSSFLAALARLEATPRGETIPA